MKTDLEQIEENKKAGIDLKGPYDERGRPLLIGYAIENIDTLKRLIEESEERNEAFVSFELEINLTERWTVIREHDNEEMPRYLCEIHDIDLREALPLSQEFWGLGKYDKAEMYFNDLNERKGEF